MGPTVTRPPSCATPRQPTIYTLKNCFEFENKNKTSLKMKRIMDKALLNIE